MFIKYIGENKTNAPTFNGNEIMVIYGDIFECSEKNARNVTRMYPRLFKKVLEESLVEETKESLVEETKESLVEEIKEETKEEIKEVKKKVIKKNKRKYM